MHDDEGPCVDTEAVSETFWHGVCNLSNTLCQQILEGLESKGVCQVKMYLGGTHTVPYVSTPVPWQQADYTPSQSQP